MGKLLFLCFVVIGLMISSYAFSLDEFKDNDNIQDELERSTPEIIDSDVPEMSDEQMNDHSKYAVFLLKYE